MPSQQLRIIQGAKCSYLPPSHSPLGKALRKQTKTIENHDEKQVEALQSLDLNDQKIHTYQPQTKSIEDIFPKGYLNNEAKDELYKIVKKNKKLTEII